MAKGIKWVVEKAKTKVKPNETPTKVSSSAKWQVKKVQQAGNMAVEVTKGMLAGAIQTASSLSKTAYSSVKQTEKGKEMEKALEGPKAQMAAKAAVVTVSAAWEIYLSFANAAVRLVEDVADATGDMVEHKYGKEAGDLAHDALS
eukprot:UN33130